MSSRSVHDLLYDSAAALRLVDRELQTFRDLGPDPEGEAHSVPNVGSTERRQDSAAEVMAGLGRVRQLLHDSHFGIPDATTGREL